MSIRIVIGRLSLRTCQWRPGFLLILASLGLLLHIPAYSQITPEEAADLLDSVDVYELRNAGKAMEFAMTVLQGLPENENPELCVRAMLGCANCLKMMSKTEPALTYCNEAITLAARIKDPQYAVRAHFMKASVFDQVDDQDSALVYYQNVMQLHKPGVSTYFVSSAYSNVGQIFRTIGNDEKAEEYILEGYRLSTGNNYARVFALSRVISFYSSKNDPRYLPYLDTLAESDFYRKASPESFLAHFDSFLRLEDASDAEREARLREVYAYALQHSSLVNQVGFGMKLYEFLSDRHRYAEAMNLLDELLEKAEVSGNAFHVAGVLRALYETSRARNAPEDALRYLERHSRLRDSLLSEESRQAISELNIRYETAQKDHEIAAQATLLEQARRKRIFQSLVIGLLTALAIMTFFFFRSKTLAARRIAAQEKRIHDQEKEHLLREKEVAELTTTLETQERERNRIARDLHDGLGSLMSGISSQIEFLRSRQILPVAEESLAHLREMVKDATAELRRTSYELMPARLLRAGLEPAVRDLCVTLLGKKGIKTHLEFSGDMKLDHQQELTVYRILQELLNNIVRHAEATEVLIQVTRYDREISVVVEDNGKGFDLESAERNGGLGLGSLRSRVDLLRGSMDIASTPGEGTTVTVNFRGAEFQADASIGKP